MTPPPRLVSSVTVLMPFDGTPQSLWTLPIAQTIARVMAGSLHLVHSGEKGILRERLPLPFEETTATIFHEMLGDLASGIARLATCSPDAVIVTPAYGATRPESGLGLFPEEILRLAQCPVLVVQPTTVGTSWKPGRVLVPQDGTVASAKALCPAARLAERSGAEMLILHVSSDRTSPAPKPGALEFPAYVDQPQHEWPSYVTAFLERVRHLCDVSSHTSLRFHWTQGDPAEEILTFARQRSVDLITLSWHGCLDPGRSQIARQVLRDAPCPVLILPCDPDAE